MAGFSPSSWRRDLAYLLLASLICIGACAHPSKSAGKTLWIPPDAKADQIVEGRELWIDVELSGYTRQELERFSDYEAAHDPAPPE